MPEVPGRPGLVVVFAGLETEGLEDCLVQTVPPRCPARAHDRVTSEQFDAMLREQQGRCGICRTPFATDHFTPDPAALPKIDRSSDGTVRGLLCPRCKIALSTFQDDVDRLRAAVGYLER